MAFFKKSGDPLIGSGETNTASNVGAGGLSVFKQKTGVDLEFNSINAASNKLTVVADAGNNEIDLDVDQTKIDATALLNAIKDKLDATVAPVVGNDNTEGYAVGSHWADVTADKAYICLDAATGASVWVEVTGGGGGESSSPSIGYDLVAGSYDSVSFSVTTQEGDPQGIFFKDDGTKLYMVGVNTDTVYQYSLPTPWVLTGMSYDSVFFSLASQDTNPNDIFFKPDGTKMYMVGATGDSVYQYSLPTPWVLTGMSYDSVSFSVSSQDTAPNGIFFKSDGTKMYMVGISSDTVYQYSLPTAWVLTGMSYDTVSFSVASEDTSPTGIFFKPDGTKMYMVGASGDTVDQYSLPTPWVLTGMSYDSISFSVASQETNPNLVFFKDDGTKMYTAGSINGTIYQYSVSANEINTGRTWDPDGKAIFRRTIALADTGVGGTETVPIGATVDTLTDLGGYVIRSSDSAKLPLPYADKAANLSVEVRVNSAGTDVIITSGSSQNHNGGYVWLEYTK